MLPNDFPLENDELFVSWVLRMTNANGCANPNTFILKYAQDNYGILDDNPRAEQYKKKFDYYSPEINSRRADIHSDIDRFIKTTMYPVEQLHMSDSEAARYVEAFFPYNRVTRINPHRKSVANEFKVCPECLKENIAYIQRAHQISKVAVCHKHGTLLETYKYSNYLFAGKVGFTKIDDSMTQPRHYDQEYAQFVYGLLRAELDIKKEQVDIIIGNRKKDLGYTNLDLADKFHEEGFDYLLGQQQKRIYNAGFPLLFFLFRDAKTFLDYSDNKIEVPPIPEEFIVIDDKRADIVQVRHMECGNSFIIPRFFLDTGWGCPFCYDGNDDKLFRKMCSNILMDDYEVQSSYKGNSTKVKMFHSKCGEAFDTVPRKILYEGLKCPCENKIPVSEVKEKIEKTGEFELVKYVSSVVPVRIRHKTCGREFDFDYFKFIKNPWCKVCNPRIRTNTTFKREIRALVGDEYTLIGDYVDKETKVAIRHNTCGGSKWYYPRKFLSGQRCDKCTRMIYEKELNKNLSDLTNGRWEISGVIDKNYFELRDNETGQIKKLDRYMIMQELKRPTSSKVIPHRITAKKFEVPVRTVYEVMAWINKKRQTGEKFFYKVEIEMAMQELTSGKIQRAIDTNVQKKRIKVVCRGIYVLPNESFSDEELENAKMNRRQKLQEKRKKQV